MAKTKRNKRDSYSLVKSHQHVTRLQREFLHDWMIDEIYVNSKTRYLNKRRRSRMGFIQTRKSV